MTRRSIHDNRKYNYVYKITNMINSKIYIGVHRTDNIDDGYMGSGSVLRRAIKKYGIHNFNKKILYQCDSYKEALEIEESIVTLEFIECDNNYNIKVGGMGHCVFSQKHKDLISEKMKNLWSTDSHKQKMRKVYDNPERSIKISKSRKKWRENNPKLHKEYMDRINKNPEKIIKTANTHRGMKRTEQTRKNISDAILKSNDDSKIKKKRSGEGLIYIHNPDSGERKRFKKGEPIPKGWKRGMGARPNKGMTIYIHNVHTEEYKKIKKGEPIPKGWKRGMGPSQSRKNKGCFFVYNPETHDIKKLNKGDVIPDGYTLGRRPNTK
jgi:hypothetical protein